MGSSSRVALASRMKSSWHFPTSRFFQVVSQSCSSAVVSTPNSIGTVIHASLQAHVIPRASESREGMVVKVTDAALPMQLGLFEGWPGQGKFLRYRHWQRARHTMDLLKTAFDHGEWPTEICEDIFTARYTKNMFDCSLGASHDSSTCVSCSTLRRCTSS